MLRGASAEALRELTGSLGSSGTLEDQAQLGRDLFGVVGVLRGDAALRRALTDNSVEGDSKAGLATAVFGKAVVDKAASLVADAASRRWTSSADLATTLERLAVITTVRSAGAKGKQVGDELFGVRRMVDTNPELRSALSDPARTSTDRSALLTGLISGKVETATETLVAEAVSRGRGSVDSALDEYLDAVRRGPRGDGRDGAHRPRAERRRPAAAVRRAEQAVLHDRAAARRPRPGPHRWSQGRDR